MRVTATLMAAAIFAAPVFAEKEPNGPVYEPGTYRFGGTYSVVAGQSASQCAAICGGDSRCMSWSFVDLPGASSQNACELKSSIGKAESNPTAISGISPRLERPYQPSPYNTRTLANGQTFTAPTSRRLYGGETTTQSAPASTKIRRRYIAPTSPKTLSPRAELGRTPPSAPATITSSAPVRMAAPAAPATVTSSAPTRIAAPAAPATVSSSAPIKMAAPSSPATITSSTPARISVPAAPATVSSSAPVKMAAPSAPATITSSAPARVSVSATPAPKAPAPAKVAAAPTTKSEPIAVNQPSAPTPKPEPTAAFTPLKTRSDGTYKQSVPAAPKPAAPASRVVLTGPMGDDVAKSVHGRVVLTGDMAGAPTGGVGETPAAPIPRNNTAITANGERVPYKNMSERDYSVTRAAEQGGVDPVGTEDLGSNLPEAGS